MPSRNLLCGALALCLAATATWAQQQAYVFNGSTIAPLNNTNGIACNHWEIWLLHSPQGVYNPYLATSAARWGVIEGNSAQAVQRQLQNAQAFQKRFEKWSGGSFGPDNYDNPVGPICITDAAFQAKPHPLEALNQLGQLAGRMERVLSSAGEWLDGNSRGLSASNPAAPYNPYLSPSAQEYLKQIADANEQVQSLYDVLSHGLATSMAQISSSLDRASQNVAAAEAAVPKLQALNNSAASQGATQSASSLSGSGSGSWQSTGMGISIKITRVNATTLTWTFRNDSSMTLRSVDFQYSYIDATTNRPTTQRDVLPLPLRPGATFGGWSAFTANTRGAVSITIGNHQFGP